MRSLGGRFWRLFASSATSNLSDGINRTTVPLLATLYSRNPLVISGLVTFAFLPWLFFALPSGALVDRLDRRYAMAAANAVRGSCAATLGVLALLHRVDLVVLYVIAFGLGVAETVYDSAVRAILPQVVDADDLDPANSALTVEETLGQTFLGAPLGSLIFAIAAAAPFLLNAAGFVLAAVLILGLRGSYRPVRTGPPSSVRHDIADGVHWLAHHPLLRGLTLLSAGTSLVQSMTTGVLVLYVLETLRLPAGDFGLVLLAAGVGALAGGVATPWLAARFGRAAVLTAGAVVCAVPTGLMGCTRNGFVAAVLYAVSASGVMAWNVLTMSLRQALIPAELFGRVQGAYRTLVWGAIPIGSLAGGALAHAVGLQAVFRVAGGGLVALSLVLWWLLRRHPLDSAQSLGQGALGRGDSRPTADELDAGLDLGRQEAVRAGTLDEFA